jgi:hypothetical protein
LPSPEFESPEGSREFDGDGIEIVCETG